MKAKLTYTDFVTGKPKWTRGEFKGWTKGGPLGAKYAVFQRSRSVLYIPAYCLTVETRQSLPQNLEAC